MSDDLNEPQKVSTPEEIEEAIRRYERVAGHPPPAAMAHPETIAAFVRNLPKARADSFVGGFDLLPRPYMPRGAMIFCERDGSFPGWFESSDVYGSSSQILAGRYPPIRGRHIWSETFDETLARFRRLWEPQ